MEEKALPNMKDAVQARRYVGELARVLLCKQGQGTLKAHMVRGTVIKRRGWSGSAVVRCPQF